VSYGCRTSKDSPNNMYGLVKKSTKYRKKVQLVVAVVCLFVTFVIPLKHICGPSKTCSRNSHFDRLDCSDNEMHTSA